MNQALTAIALSDPVSAGPLLEKSRLAAERIPEPLKFEALAMTAEARAALAAELEEPVEREQLLRESLAIREGAGLSPLPALFPLCDVLIELGRFDEARQTHERILADVKPKARPHDRRLHYAYVVMAEAYRERGMLEESLPFYEQASVARMYSEGSGRFDVAPALDGWAQALEGLGRDDDALAVRDQVDWIVTGRTYTDDVIVKVYGAARFTTPLRWKRSQMPLDVFIEDPPPDWQGDPEALIATAREAVLAWADVVEPGVPSFEFTTSRLFSDLEIGWVQDRGEGWVGHANAGKFKLAHTPLRNVEIRVLTSAAGGNQPALAWIRRVVLHEVGHAVGLFGHSSYSRDLMYPVLGEDNPEISERDRDTLREVYDMEIQGRLW